MSQSMDKKRAAPGRVWVPVLLVLATGCFGFGGPGGKEASVSPQAVVSAGEVRGLLTAENAPLVLDVRTEWEYESGRIHGSVRMPIQDFLTGASAKKLAHVPKERLIILYCHSGVRSNLARDVLLREGFTNVMDFHGGIVEWNEAGYPVATNRPKVHS